MCASVVSGLSALVGFVPTGIVGFAPLSDNLLRRLPCLAVHVSVCMAVCKHKLGAIRAPDFGLPRPTPSIADEWVALQLTPESSPR